jgi:hypothetical protein
MANEVASRTLMQTDVVRLVVHPPERQRQRAGVPVQAGDCCSCCCCCCLHSLGSLIGAVAAGREPVRDTSTPPSAVSAASIFWWTVLVLILIATVLGLPFMVVGGLFVSLMALPLVQLLASLVTLLILVGSTRPDRDLQLKQLGKITLGVVIGTFFGGLALGVLLLVVCAH